MTRLILLLCFTLPGLVQAQAPKPYYCEASPPHRAFDFWLGNWEVTDRDGKTVYGKNTISSRERGCLLLEEWKSARSGTGTSMNYYDPSSGKWHQHWVDSNGIIHTAGGIVDGSMVMEGSVYYLNQGRKAAFRGKWTPMEDGRIRQFFEEQDDQGEWQPWFEGFYRRVD